MMKMKRCLIVTGGTIDIAFAKDFLSQRSYDYVIAADAGLEVLRPLHISPNAVVGDLDTVDKKVLEEYQNQPDIEFEIHKPEKDETDTELALLTAARQGCEAVDILGALGGRMDHAIGNIQLMYQFFCQGMEVNIYDARNRLYLLVPRRIAAGRSVDPGGQRGGGGFALPGCGKLHLQHLVREIGRASCRERV